MDIRLNNDNYMPALGFGTWKLENGNAADAVYSAISAGYRHIDCAMIYTNEKEVGHGIRRAIESGLVKREELFVTSKLWNTDHDPRRVGLACRKSLSDLGLDYLDLYLVHWGVAFDDSGELEPLDENGVTRFAPIPLQSTWRAMEELVESGLTRSLGVANYNAALLLDLLSYAEIKPVTNQIELHPYHAQQALVDFCNARGIILTAYSPLSSAGSDLLDNDSLKLIGEQHGKTPAQVALRWALQRGTAAIPKSSHEERIVENFAIFDFSLNAEEMESITALDKRFITCNPIDWWGFPYF